MTGPKVLGELHQRWFEKRGISVETAAKYEVYTGRFDGDAEAVAPDDGGNILVFPFVENGRVVGEKYRAPNKKFWQRAGGKRTFWNSDALDDPALAAGRMPLVITEGEIDALTAIDCGFPLTVSVPDGAPAVADGESPEDLKPIDPDREAEGKFEFLWNNRSLLKAVRRFILAVDNDKPGKRLEAELLRRLSASRCMFVTYPAGCKDLNEVRVTHGAEAVAAVLNAAKPYPVRGLYRLSEYPEPEPLRKFLTGIDALDDNVKLFSGEFMVVTGIPSHGKSTVISNICVGLAEQYGFRSVIFSPEMPAVPQLRDKFRRIRLRKSSMDIRAEEAAECDRWLNEHFVFIDADPTGREDEEFDLDWVLDRATDAVLRDGIRVLVIDPWNEIEHAKRRDETMTEYIGRSIRALKRFGRLYDVIVIVAVHPTKEVGKEGRARMPTLYDADGSAHWYNKCDHGMIVHRPRDDDDESVIRIAKVRFDDTGKKGTVRLKFNKFSCRYEELQEEPAADDDDELPYRRRA